MGGGEEGEERGGREGGREEEGGRGGRERREGRREGGRKRGDSELEIFRNTSAELVCSRLAGITHPHMETVTCI